MPQQYSQIRAMISIVRASLKATLRSPQSVIFSLFFPVILIWIFGSLGGNNTPAVSVAFEKNSDSTTFLHKALKGSPVLRFTDPSKKDIEDELRKGRITAILGIQRNPDTSGAAPYVIGVRSSSASQRDLGLLTSVLNASINGIDSSFYPQRPTVAVIRQQLVAGGRKYKMIDFFLPGMIGFSLIGTAVFAIAFSFYSLRETLVLKRMYSTPVRRIYIILGEGLAKVIFQMMTVVMLILFGYFVYGFTLANGVFTFLSMLVLSFIALLVFMGFGFLITGVARNQNVIPIYANLFMFPQYFLSGTFFPKTALPQFLQPVIQFLPLTALNDAMRNVAFEGTSLASCWPQLLVLLGWGVVIYLVTVKVFRWE